MKNYSMKKIILWNIVSLVIAGIAVGAFLWLRQPQVILLKDGTKLTLVGVEYGKHHKCPAVKTKSGVRRGDGGWSSFDTTNDTLVVWILQEYKGNQWPNYQLFVYDSAETPASPPGPAAAQTKSRPAFIFKAFPSMPFRAGIGRSSCALARGTTWTAECRKPKASSSFPIPPASIPMPNGRRSRCRTRSPTAI